MQFVASSDKHPCRNIITIAIEPNPNSEISTQNIIFNDSGTQLVDLFESVISHLQFVEISVYRIPPINKFNFARSECQMLTLNISK